MEYVKPSTIIVKAEADILLLGSGAEARPGATDIGSPSVRNNSKSIWDEDAEDNETIDYDI